MTDHVLRRNPHKWHDVIVAWAAGAEILVRTWNILKDKWDDWCVLESGHCPMRTDIYVEYRIAPKNPDGHPWQKEKEAYLAGLAVEYRGKPEYDDVKGNNIWRRVDDWILAWAVNSDDCKLELWDRNWLEFRIVHELKEINLFVNRFGGIIKNPEKPNMQVILQDGQLREARVLN